MGSLLLTLLVASCQTSRLNPLEYAHWVNNPSNGLQVAVEGVNGKHFLAYQPPAYQAILAQKPKDWNDPAFRAQLSEGASLQIYTLYLPPSKSLQAKSSAFDASTNRFWMVDGKDTLECVHLHPINDLKNSTTLLLGFPRLTETDQQAKTLLIQDMANPADPLEMHLSAAALQAHANLLNI